MVKKLILENLKVLINNQLLYLLAECRHLGELVQHLCRRAVGEHPAEEWQHCIQPRLPLCLREHPHGRGLDAPRVVRKQFPEVCQAEGCVLRG